MTGGGKYEKETREFREKVLADGVVTIVCNGYLGHGFEVHMPPEIAHLVPKTLREIADKMEADIEFLTTQQPNG